jgi:hypothetical protein
VEAEEEGGELLGVMPFSAASARRSAPGLSLPRAPPAAAAAASSSTSAARRKAGVGASSGAGGGGGAAGGRRRKRVAPAAAADGGGGGGDILQSASNLLGNSTSDLWLSLLSVGGGGGEDDEGSEDGDSEDHDDDEDGAGEDEDCGEAALTDASGERGVSELARLAAIAAKAARTAAAAAASAADPAALPSGRGSHVHFTPSGSSSSAAAGAGPLGSRAARQSGTPLAELLTHAGADGDTAFAASSNGNDVFTARAAATISATGPDTLVRCEAVASELEPGAPLSEGGASILRGRLQRPTVLTSSQLAARERLLGDCYNARAALSEHQHGGIFDADVAVRSTFPVEKTNGTTWALAKPGGRKGDSPEGVAVAESMGLELALNASFHGLSTLTLDADNHPRHWNSGSAARNGRSAAIQTSARDVIEAGFPMVLALGTDSGESLRAAMGSLARDVSSRFGYGAGYVLDNGVTLLFIEVHAQNLLPTKGDALRHALRWDGLVRGVRAAAGLSAQPTLSLVGFVLRLAEGLSGGSAGAHQPSQLARASELRAGTSLPFEQQLPRIQLSAAAAGYGNDTTIAGYRMHTRKAQTRWSKTGPSTAAVVASQHGIAGGACRRAGGASLRRGKAQEDLQRQGGWR